MSRLAGWRVLSSCAVARDVYAAVAPCGRSERCEPECAFHAIVMDSRDKEIRTWISFDKDWQPFGECQYDSPDDAELIAELLVEARGGPQHRCSASSQ